MRGRLALAGLVVRQLKQQWRLALPLMALHDLPCGTTLMDSAECTVVFDVAPHADESDPAEAMAAQRRAALCMELLGVVQAMGLQSAWEIKPLVDGKSVMAVLGMKQACALPSLRCHGVTPLRVFPCQRRSTGT